MIGKVLKAVARAAVAQPWDYQGEGAPGDWEFRVNPEEDVIAFYNPDKGCWTFLSTFQVLAEETDLGAMDRHTQDWRQFLSVEDPDGLDT